MKRKNKNNVIKEKILIYKNIINIALLIILCTLILSLIIISVRKQKEYNVQGEKKLPFIISEINVFSKFNIERKEEEVTDKAIISMLDDVVLKYKNIDNGMIKKITYKNIQLENIDSIDKYELYTINMRDILSSNETKSVEENQEIKTKEESNILRNINKKIENKEITFINNNIENNEKKEKNKEESKEVTTFFRILYDKKKEKVISKEELIKYNELSKEEDLEVYKNIKIRFNIEIEMIDGKIYETEITISKETPIKENNLIKYTVKGIENLKFKRKN